MKKPPHKAKTPHLDKPQHPTAQKPLPAKSPKTKNKPYFFGTHAVMAIITHRPTDIKTVFVQSADTPIHTDITALAHTLGISVQSIHKDKLSQLTGTTHHQGIAIDVKPAPSNGQATLERLISQNDVLLLILDQITDTHNLGACMRTAAAMGVDAVIIPKHQSVGITPTVAKVAVGATEMIPLIHVTNLARTLETIKQAGVFVFGTTLDDTAIALHECNLTGKVAIVMGSEGDGLRHLTTKLCDTLTYIPMTNQKNRPQSLNVSVATGIALYEAHKQRHLTNNAI